MTTSNFWSDSTWIGYQYTQSFTLTNADGSPYNVTGATWEYVVRLTADDVSAVPLIRVTTAADAQGVITVATGTATVIGLTLNPVATAGLAPGAYAHALVMNPGTTSAFVWVAGQLVLAAAAQT